VFGYLINKFRPVKTPHDTPGEAGVLLLCGTELLLGARGSVLG
jgi:hypothetical protein